MPADPPPSLLISPDLRRRLQQRYEEASRLAGQSPVDFTRVHGLLAECLRADPGNILYIDALLANLRRREKSRAETWFGKWFGWLGRNKKRQANCGEAEEFEPASESSSLSTKYAVLNTAPDSLWHQPANASLLRELAEAAAALDFKEAELRYLYAARDLAPDDPTTLRKLARSLTRQGRFEDAVGPWFAVVALADDREAAQAVEDLHGAKESEETEDALAAAQAAAGGDLVMLEKRENARLARSTLRIELARRRAAHDAHPQAQALVASLEAEYLRLEIDILNARAERWPTDVEVRLELSRRLKRMGNFSGAIQRLDETQMLEPMSAAVGLELGENWQHLRQFGKAIDFYQGAIERAAGDPELLNLARYRAAVLAAALGRIVDARMWLTAIVAADPAFKDARQRLDKLPAT